jgi:acetylornithine deacetylase/succinyl-diaminopimelate desuccinylase-like protein
MQQTDLISLNKFREYFQNHREEIIADYFTFLSFQSISSEKSYAPQVLKCADWLVKYLKNMNFDVQLWPTSGHPTIFASDMRAGPEKPTLLIYNHYDVQPVDPLQDWLSSPFEPSVRDGVVYARGAQDNKGQCFYTIQALKALTSDDQRLPINIKLCIEGEEECGSAELSKILTQKQKELKADYLAIVDLGIPDKNTPAVTLGIRGIVTMDLTVHCSNTDLHSGSHGGLVYNPLHAIAKILASLHDSTGKVTVPGFYDAVVPLSEAERSQITLTFDQKHYQKIFGTIPSGGEQEYSPRERTWLRPTVEINGISGGYTGQGFKTVIPAQASAKISCRLVANQDPQTIGPLVAKFLEEQAPPGTTVHVSVHPGGGKAVRTSPSSTVVQAFAQAYSDVFKAPCEFIFEGGSIPIVTELAIESGSEVVLVGLGLVEDQVHAPNEHFGLDRLEQGFLIMIRAIEILGS